MARDRAVGFVVVVLAEDPRDVVVLEPKSDGVEERVAGRATRNFAMCGISVFFARIGIGGVARDRIDVNVWGRLGNIQT